MNGELKIALAQLNPVMGDLAGNTKKLIEARRAAAALDADLLITGELYLCGYPPEDLVLKTSFLDKIKHHIQLLLEETKKDGPSLLIGTPWLDGDKLYNAMLLLDRGQIAATTYKCDLPNYGPFDEKRIFAATKSQAPVDFHGHKLGVLICEDMWTSSLATKLKAQGAEILIVPNGSPYETDKRQRREEIARQRVAETRLPLIYVNQVGGQDELVFDGASFVMDEKGEIQSHLMSWEEDLKVVAFPLQESAEPQENTSKEETIYNALVLALRDYVTKNGFSGVVLGLSGGIDSALVAAIAVDALGPHKVRCVMMPSPYTSQDSLDDAAANASNLGCHHEIISICELMQAFDTTLKESFVTKKPDVTEENIQARCRGVILMALSNKFGHMVLSTGNKSEMSVGYSTLYGDLCGGFAVLKDVYKTQVYKLARWRNAHKPESGQGPSGVVIPERILTKAPTAELRPNQKDQDSLPPYDVLDDILECLIEEDLGLQEITARGHNAAMIKRVWSMLDRAEYKRRQAPPGVKITRRILGKDRRYPITNKYSED